MADPRFKRPTRQVSFRWDPALKALLEQSAADAGMTLTAFVLGASLIQAGHSDLAPSHMRQEVLSLKDSA